MKSRVIKIVSSLAIGIGIAAAPASSYAATPKTMKVHYITLMLVKEIVSILKLPMVRTLLLMVETKVKEMQL